MLFGKLDVNMKKNKTRPTYCFAIDALFYIRKKYIFYFICLCILYVLYIIFFKGRMFQTGGKANEKGPVCT